MNRHIVKHIVSVGPSKSGLMNKAQGTKNGPSKSGLGLVWFGGLFF